MATEPGRHTRGQQGSTAAGHSLAGFPGRQYRSCPQGGATLAAVPPRRKPGVPPSARRPPCVSDAFLGSSHVSPRVPGFVTSCYPARADTRFRTCSGPVQHGARAAACPFVPVTLLWLAVHLKPQQEPGSNHFLETFCLTRIGFHFLNGKHSVTRLLIRERPAREHQRRGAVSPTPAAPRGLTRRGGRGLVPPHSVGTPPGSCSDATPSGCHRLALTGQSSSAPTRSQLHSQVASALSTSPQAWFGVCPQRSAPVLGGPVSPGHSADLSCTRSGSRTSIHPHLPTSPSQNRRLQIYPMPPPPPSQPGRSPEPRTGV